MANQNAQGPKKPDPQPDHGNDHRPKPDRPVRPHTPSGIV
jgi:hypothetical protein